MYVETILIAWFSVSLTADLYSSGANLDDELAPAPTLSGLLLYIIFWMPFDELLGLRINGESRVLVPKGINIY